MKPKFEQIVTDRVMLGLVRVLGEEQMGDASETIRLVRAEVAKFVRDFKRTRANGRRSVVDDIALAGLIAACIEKLHETGVGR